MQQNYSLDELREMKELTEAIKQNLATIEASGWTLNELDDMRKEAESTAARLEDIEKAS